MRSPRPSVTSLPPSPDEERHGRMIRYGIAMGIRVVCIGLCLVVPGWWVVVPVLGAVFLPYFAVLIANTTRRVAGGVERPGGLERTTAAPRDRDEAA